MKKALLFFILSVFVLTTKAQEISIIKTTKLNLDKPAFFASFGNSDNFVFFTNENQRGLILYNISDKSLKKISEAPGAVQKVFMNKKGKVNFVETDFINGRRKEINKIFNPETGKTEVAKSNDFPEIEAKVFGKSIEIVKKGSEKIYLKPLGDFYYLWVSLSPDKTKLLFTVGGKGTYVSDINGENILEMDNLNAPVWINNNWIAGMDDTDNGETIICSDIIAKNIYTKKVVNLTFNDNNIAVYPKVSKSGDKIVYHTTDGQVFILNIEISN